MTRIKKSQPHTNWECDQETSVLEIRMACGDTMTTLLLGFATMFGVVSGLISGIGLPILFLMWLGRRLGIN